ncbi:MAG TPA: CZB domain-containing protein [Hydrogenophaga sp.]|uniref:CZB domain-containing protein n=1 Tax=Hydrogenophaga sp. TaxID=1904254 RepID=UPI002D18129C|nr:CZB domain-containing protein [Hydrogenophaga sp.]HMN92878.1 CZB domain-containing protein [Hydrogenophaga sp.]HMP10905.1 CZB domain-containing protein [Hydrogenophaga sp.]
MNIPTLLQHLYRRRPTDSTSSGHGDLPMPATQARTPPQPPKPAAERLPTGPVHVAGIDRQDLKQAIIMHLEWCVLFNEHLGADKSLPPPQQDLPGERASGLGQWLTLARQRPPAQHPYFGELLQEHQRFHELANQALGLARIGRMDAASTLLNTDFERSRARVLEILRAIQKSAG